MRKQPSEPSLGETWSDEELILKVDFVGPTHVGAWVAKSGHPTFTHRKFVTRLQWDRFVKRAKKQT